MDLEFVTPWTPVGEFAENLLMELQREVGEGHPLWMQTLRPIAQRIDSDDVLFEIERLPPNYAVVHLTWSGTREESSMFPDTKLFSSLDEWICDGMMKDHQEYMGGEE